MEIRPIAYYAFVYYVLCGLFVLLHQQFQSRRIQIILYKFDLWHILAGFS